MAVLALLALAILGLGAAIDVDATMSDLAESGAALRCATVTGDTIAAATGTRVVAWTDGAMQTVDLATPHESAICGLAASPDTKALASSDGSTVRLWSTDTWEQAHEYAVPYGATGAPVFVGDGRELAWAVPPGTAIAEILKSGGSYPRTLLRVALVNASNGEVRRFGLVWPSSVTVPGIMDREGILGSLRVTEQVGAMAQLLAFGFSDVGVSASTDGRWVVVPTWVAEDAEVVAATHYVETGEAALEAMPGAELWSCESGTREWALERNVFMGGHGLTAISRDGDLLAFEDNEGIAVWDVASRDRSHVLQLDEENATALAFSTDASVLYAGTDSGLTLAWDLTTGEIIQRFSDAHGQVLAVGTFGPANALATVGEDGSIVVWNTDSGGWDRRLHVLDDGGWVMLTSTGRYDASPGCDALVHTRMGPLRLPTAVFGKLKKYRPGNDA